MHSGVYVTWSMLLKRVSSAVLNDVSVTSSTNQNENKLKIRVLNKHNAEIHPVTDGNS